MLSKSIKNSQITLSIPVDVRKFINNKKKKKTKTKNNQIHSILSQGYTSSQQQITSAIFALIQVDEKRNYTEMNKRPRDT